MTLYLVRTAECVRLGREVSLDKNVSRVLFSSSLSQDNAITTTHLGYPLVHHIQNE